MRVDLVNIATTIRAAARLHAQLVDAGRMTPAEASRLDFALAREVREGFDAAWTEFQRLASDRDSSPEVLERARARFPREDVVDWVFARLHEGLALADADAKWRHEVARA